jgi:magnesium transporter
LSVFKYDIKNYEEFTLDSVKNIKNHLESGKNIWINVDGLHDIDIVQKLGSYFGFHSLLLEDIVNTNQRPKTDQYKDYIFTSLKMFYIDKNSGNITSEHVSLILGKNYLISFQEKPGDVFDLIRERIRTEKGKVRAMKCDYLWYALIDAIVDNYFVVLDNFNEQIEAIENDVISNPGNETINKIYSVKKEVNYLKKSVWPLRELISYFLRENNPVLSDEINLYLRDLYDHVIQILDFIETFRDNLSSLMDLYLNTISNKMNSIMKVLTIISTMFIPVTFIAGLYGMNFKNMPETEYKYGYFIVLGVMLLVIGSMIMFFKKKKWL